MYERYRKNVIDRYGEKVDTELRYGAKYETVKEEIVDPETGKKTKVKKDVLIMPDGTELVCNEEYARIWEFGATDKFESNSEEYNRIFLEQTQRAANKRLKERGYLFLNEVYEMLGFPPTETGRIVGWIYDPYHKITDESYPGDSEVDFQMHDVRHPNNEEFINGFQPYILLDFNVDGDFTKDGLYIKNHMFRNW